MKVARRNLGSLGVFTLGAFAACQIHASTWTVSFDPAAPVNTNGWDLGKTTEQKERSSTQPGGRKFDPAKGSAVSIESPLYEANIRMVALSAWGNTLNSTSRVEVWGRADVTSAYTLLFSRAELSNKLLENEPLDRITVPEDFACRQLKIGYTKSGGTWVLAKVTVTDDAIRAEPPTNLRTEVVDAEARCVRVSWDLAAGLSESEWRTFTTATVGGIGDSETLWRESFDGVPAAEKATKLDATALAALGFGDWDAVNVRQSPVAGALLIGWGSHDSGSLTTPPLGRDLAAEHTLVIRAATRDVNAGILPIAVVSGIVTSHVADVAITKTPQDCQVSLPALAATDRIFVHSLTNFAAEQTFIYDLAICADGAYVAESVVTNAASDVTSVQGHSVEMIVPTGGTNLWIEARTVYGDETSAWSEPFLVSLSDTGSGESDGDGENDDSSALAAPSRIRAGRLPDGRIRVGWNVPDGATNVKLRVWTRTTSGGLAAVAEGDILWRETFAHAPATNSSVAVSTEEKLRLYTDRGADGWDVSRCVSVALATEASALKIGTGDKTGALASKSLNVSGEGLTLVVTAKRGTGEKNSGVTLKAATLSSDGSQTNVLGQSATLAAEWTECVFTIPVALTGDESLLVASVIGTPKDGRALLDDIALVRNYVAASVVTNERLFADCGLSASYDFAAADHGSVLFASLSAQGADGLTSDWTEPFALDPSALGEWNDRHVTMRTSESQLTFDVDGLPRPDGKNWDVSESPFRFLVQGEEVFTLANRDATKQLNVGVYVCTNVFEKNWVVLIPGSPDTVAEVKDAECRLTIRTDAFAARRLELSGTFAQLNASNENEKRLLLQYRAIRPDGTTSDWQTMGEYVSTYMSADLSPDLVGTQTNLSCAVDVRFPRGSTVEARVYCRKTNESGREPPLGFRDLRVRVLGVGPSLVFVIR